MHMQQHFKIQHTGSNMIEKEKCIDKLERRGKVSVRNLTPIGRLGKLRSYWEPEITEVLSRYKLM